MTDQRTAAPWKKTIIQALLLAALGVAAGLALNIRHVVNYARGDYVRAFSGAPADEDPPLIGLAEAEDLFALGLTVFIDARSSEEFEAGHIFGAVNVPLYDPRSDMIWESLAVPPEAQVVVYCSGDFCQDSLILARRIKRLGWRNIKVYAGGWGEWNAAGRPVESGR